MAIAAAGLAVGFAKAGTAHPQAASSPRAANAVTHVTVAASEFKFVFSKRSIPAAGTVIFTVVNKGKISHNFKIGGKVDAEPAAREVREARPSSSRRRATTRICARSRATRQPA